MCPEDAFCFYVNTRYLSTVILFELDRIEFYRPTSPNVALWADYFSSV